MITPEQVSPHRLSSAVLNLNCFAQAKAVRESVMSLDLRSSRSGASQPDLDETLLAIINSYHFEFLPSLDEMLHRPRSLRSWILWSYANCIKTGETLHPDLCNRLRQRKSLEPGESEALRIMCLVRPCAAQVPREWPQVSNKQVPTSLWEQLGRGRIAWLHAKRGEWSKAAATSSLEWMKLTTEWQAMQALLHLIYGFLSGEFNLSATATGLDTLSQGVSSRFVLARFHLELFQHYLGWLDCRSYATASEESWKIISTLLPREQESDVSLLKTLLGGPSAQLWVRVWNLTNLGTIDLSSMLASPALAPAALWLQDALQQASSIQHLYKPSQQQEWQALNSKVEKGGSRMWKMRCALQELVIARPSRSTRLEVERLGLQLRVLGLDAAYWRTTLALMEAADYYRSGCFASCIQQLIEARRRANCPELKTIIDLWLATAEGRVSHMLEPHAWARSQGLARLLFAPQLINLGEGRYRVSGHYEVDLRSHPVLNRLLKALLHEHEGGLPTAELQRQVWRQSTSLEGWNQKIRNTLGRLRLSFRFTLVPIVLLDGGLIQLNHEVLAIATPPLPRKNEREKELLRLMERGPISSRLIASRTKIPLSTVKRLLSDLLKAGKICATRQHQTFLYSLHPEQQPNPPKNSQAPSQIY
jgi:DNA-binding CsgD family transcriptional regulator